MSIKRIKKSISTNDLAKLSILFGLGLIVRLIGITSRPIWYDEAFAVLFAQKGFTAMLYGTLTTTQGVASDVHPLGYYTLFWLWMKLFGNSILFSRIFSIIFGMGIVVIGYAFGKKNYSSKTGLLFGGLIAFSPFLIHYAQEIRMYAMLGFFLFLGWLALWQGMQTGKPIWWVLFSLSAAISQYVHNLALFTLIPLAAIPVLMRKWKSVRAILFAGLGALILYLPWLMQLPGQFAKVQSNYWTQKPGLERLVTTLISFMTNLPLPGNFLPIGLFISLVVFFMAGRQTWLAWKQKLPGWQNGLWFAYLAFMPVLFLYSFSQWMPVYLERALPLSVIAFLLWVGWALLYTNLPRLVMWFVMGMIFLGMGIGIYQHIYYRGFPYAPYREIVQKVHEQIKPGEILLHANKLTMLPSVYYDRDLPQKYMADASGSGSDTLALPTQEVLRLIADVSIERAIGEAPGVWFLVFERELMEYKASGIANHPDLEKLGNYYQLDNETRWGDTRLYYFRSN